jgi:hypothetical protein
MCIEQLPTHDVARERKKVPNWESTNKIPLLELTDTNRGLMLMLLPEYFESIEQILIRREHPLCIFKIKIII